VAKVGVDRRLVGGGPVGHHHLDLPAPPAALAGQEPVQGLGVAVLDHPEQRAALAVLAPIIRPDASEGRGKA